MFNVVAEEPDAKHLRSSIYVVFRCLSTVERIPRYFHEQAMLSIMKRG